MSDSMTQLPNYRAFLDVLEDHIAEATRGHDRSLSVLTIDVRRFKEINRTLGHGFGDAVLGFVASTVSENLRTMDLIARHRNDEFLVVLPTASEKMAKMIIMRIEDTFRERRLEIEDSAPLHVELNIGWAVFGKDGDSAQSLIARARIRKDSTKTSSTPGRVVLFPSVLT